MTALASLDILDRLVGFPTVSSDSNLDLIHWIRDHLEGLGCPVRLVFDADGRKANLLARVGPAGHGGIVLSGHTDVVPVADQAWTSDPFALTRRGDRVYGRGSADMKGFIAACLAMVPRFLELGLSRPVHLAFSYDEEIGCLGVPGLISALQGEGLRPGMVVIGEPSSMRIIDGHKGYTALTTTVSGLAAHSARPMPSVSAIAVAAELVGFIDAAARAARQELPHDDDFDPPHATFNVGRIEGGTATNIIADRCSFDWDHRWLPGESHADFRNSFDNYASDQVIPRHESWGATARIETICRANVTGFARVPNSTAVEQVAAVTGSNARGTVAFGSEAGLFQQAGLPTVLIGPGDIDQAHKADEFISLDQLYSCEIFLLSLVRANQSW